jgi:hypothetical protein
MGAFHGPSISSPGRGGKTLAHGVSRGDTAPKNNSSPGGAIREPGRAEHPAFRQIPTPTRPILIAPPGLEIRYNATPMAHAMGFRSFGPPGLRSGGRPAPGVLPGSWPVSRAVANRPLSMRRISVFLVRLSAGKHGNAGQTVRPFRTLYQPMSEPIAATPTPAPEASRDFIREIVAADLAAGRHGTIITRFPPEPNGYLHIGHAKSICLNFGIARDFSGQCNLRMDDTNPTKEDVEYVDSITEDVQWLIRGWADHVLSLKPKGGRPAASPAGGRSDHHLPGVVGGTVPSGSGNGATGGLEPFYASDYFDALYQYAEQLIQKGKAYVCDLTAEDMDAYRGAPDRAGKESPWRGRSIEESLDLFRRMRAGEFKDGARTLRARIDMTSPNVWLRDPVLYRIRHTEHHHTARRGASTRCTTSPTA